MHLESRGPQEASLIRFRRDGQLERYSEFPAPFHDAVMLKIMANLAFSAPCAVGTMATRISSLLPVKREKSTLPSCGLRFSAGCSHCKDTGYAGRLGLYEVMVADDKVRQAIRSHAPASAVQAAALASGMLTLKQDGILKALHGLTDIHEVRATSV